MDSYNTRLGISLISMLNRLGSELVHGGDTARGENGSCPKGCLPPTFEAAGLRCNMLSLQSTSSDRWLRQVDQSLNEILIDHAHCEKKAAGCALNLIFAYVENQRLCRQLIEIVNEELEHFQLVLDLLQRRGIAFRRLKPGGYGRQLNDLVRKSEPERAVDRLLVAGLIEARSCERFDLLRKHMADRDPELAEFYNSLFESEARHHSTYVQLAKSFASEVVVKQRLVELSEREASIIEQGGLLPRMHS
jgi:tRNA-(ms[2]io[6]A)-hydroxylase